MIKIGSHVSMKSPDFILGSINEALSYDANALMLYTGAPQNSFRNPVSQLKSKQALQLWESKGLDINDIIVHCPYIINLANTTKQETFDGSIEVLNKEIARVKQIGVKYMVLHPGSSLSDSAENGIKSVGKGLNICLKEEKDVVVCLETMAGKGSEVGKTFQEIKSIIDLVENKDAIGVCLDTCHIWDGGYDLTDFDKVLDEFDQIIGLDKLFVIHVNDSKNILGAHKDRHANIGQGEIGFDRLYKIVHNERLKDKVFILETPYIGVNAPYKDEIEMLRKGVWKNLME